jgi:hypothetical protein
MVMRILVAMLGPGPRSRMTMRLYIPITTSLPAASLPASGENDARTLSCLLHLYIYFSHYFTLLLVYFFYFDDNHMLAFEPLLTLN